MASLSPSVIMFERRTFPKKCEKNIAIFVHSSIKVDEIINMSINIVNANFDKTIFLNCFYSNYMSHYWVTGVLIYLLLFG